MSSFIAHLKTELLAYKEAFGLYDYAAFGWLLFLFLIILVLILLLARKKPRLSLFLVIVVLLLLFVAPFGVKYFLDQTVRKVDVVLDNSAKLQYASSLIVTGHLSNEGKVPYKTCQLTTKVFKIDSNKYKNALNSLKPLRKKTILLDKNLSKGQTMTFKVVFEKFTYAGEYNITLDAVCY